MTHINWNVTTTDGWINTYHTYSTDFGGFCVRVEEGGSEYRWTVSLDGDILQKGADPSLDKAQTQAITAAKKQPKPETAKILVRSIDLKDRIIRRIGMPRWQTLADIGEYSDEDMDYFDQPH